MWDLNDFILKKEVVLKSDVSSIGQIRNIDGSYSILVGLY